MTNENICKRCKKVLDYHERHYITEAKMMATTYCYNCFKTTICAKTGQKLTLDKLQ